MVLYDIIKILPEKIGKDGDLYYRQLHMSDGGLDLEAVTYMSGISQKHFTYATDDFKRNLVDMIDNLYDDKFILYDKDMKVIRYDELYGKIGWTRT